MNKKVEKYRAELDKCMEKIARFQARAEELKRAITEAENTEIVAAVRSLSLQPEELMKLLLDLRTKDAPLTRPAETAEETLEEFEDEPYQDEEATTEVETTEPATVEFEHSFDPSYFTYKEETNDE